MDIRNYKDNWDKNSILPTPHTVKKNIVSVCMKLGAWWRIWGGHQLSGMKNLAWGHGCGRDQGKARRVSTWAETLQHIKRPDSGRVGGVWASLERVLGEDRTIDEGGMYGLSFTEFSKIMECNQDKKILSFLRVLGELANYFPVGLCVPLPSPWLPTGHK